jgi:hypothetical protein
MTYPLRSLYSSPEKIYYTFVYTFVQADLSYWTVILKLHSRLPYGHLMTFGPDT